jgi:hypothetical protein
MQPMLMTTMGARGYSGKERKRLPQARADEAWLGMEGPHVLTNALATRIGRSSGLRPPLLMLRRELAELPKARSWRGDCRGEP